MPHLSELRGNPLAIATEDANGSPIIQYSWENNLRFKWRFENVGGAELGASNLNPPSRVIGVTGASATAGQGTPLYDYNAANIGEQKLGQLPSRIREDGPKSDPATLTAGKSRLQGIRSSAGSTPIGLTDRDSW